MGLIRCKALQDDLRVNPYEGAVFGPSAPCGEGLRWCCKALYHVRGVLNYGVIDDIVRWSTAVEGGLRCDRDGHDGEVDDGVDGFDGVDGGWTIL